jgi:AcrR family transcriptional regulator
MKSRPKPSVSGGRAETGARAKKLASGAKASRGETTPGAKASRGKLASGAKASRAEIASGAKTSPQTSATAAPRKRVDPERRAQILAAALDEFSQNGFAAARLDDVAKRAGVAKGTIYLYFKDKEALFHELLRTQISPVIVMLEAMLAGGGKGASAAVPLRVLAHRVADLFVDQVLSTQRKDIIRLILTEGPRFPKLAEFYYREVISRGVAAMRGRMQRAVNAGELDSDALARFPQLIVAPALVAIMWKSMFEKFEPLDAKALMHAHIDILFGVEPRS